LSNQPLQLDPVHQEDRNGRLPLTQVTEENLLTSFGLFAHDAAPTSDDGGWIVGCGICGSGRGVSMSA